MTKKASASAEDQQVIADEQEAERVFQEAAAVAPPRCDCTALDVPHTHEQGGPVALPEDAR